MEIKIKKSEARILIYLNQVPNELKNIPTMATKLEIDYSYITKIIDSMLEKKWIQRIIGSFKNSYEITKKAPLKQAKEVWEKLEN